MKVFNINPLSPTIIYYNGDKFTYNSDMYEVVGSSPFGYSFSDAHSQKNNPLLKIVNMNQSDEKTIYDLKKAKFEMEKEIANSILKFEKEYKVRVNRVDFDQPEMFSDYGRLVLSMIRVEAEVKL